MKIQTKKFNVGSIKDTTDNTITGGGGRVVLVMYADGFKDGHTVIREPVNRNEDYDNLSNVRSEYLSKFKEKADVDEVYLTIMDINKTA